MSMTDEEVLALLTEHERRMFRAAPLLPPPGGDVLREALCALAAEHKALAEEREARNRIARENADALHRNGELRERVRLLEQAIAEHDTAGQALSVAFPDAKPPERERHEYTPDGEWERLWSGLLEADAGLDVAQIKRELADYSMVMEFASIVYDHVTGGRCSKPNTLPSVVRQLADEWADEMADEHAAEHTAEMRAAITAAVEELDGFECELGTPISNALALLKPYVKEPTNA